MQGEHRAPRRRWPIVVVVVAVVALVGMTAEWRSAASDAGTAHAENDELSAQVSDLEERNSFLDAELGHAIDDRDSLQSANDELHVDLDDLDQLVADLSAEKLGLSTDLDAAEAARDAALVTIDQCEAYVVASAAVFHDYSDVLTLFSGYLDDGYFDVGAAQRISNGQAAENIKAMTDPMKGCVGDAQP